MLNVHKWKKFQTDQNSIFTEHPPPHNLTTKPFLQSLPPQQVWVTRVRQNEIHHSVEEELRQEGLESHRCQASTDGPQNFTLLRHENDKTAFKDKAKWKYVVRPSGEQNVSALHNKGAKQDAFCHFPIATPNNQSQQACSFEFGVFILYFREKPQLYPFVMTTLCGCFQENSFHFLSVYFFSV